MAVVIGAWMAFAGAVALLVGVSARRRVRRLKADGIKVWAQAIDRPLPVGEQPDDRLRDAEHHNGAGRDGGGRDGGGRDGGGRDGGGRDGGGHNGGGHNGAGQVTLQFMLEDGRVLERRARARRGAPLAPGQKVLVWYDPDDPADVLVYGRVGRASDLAFVAIGLVFLLVGVAIAIFAP